MMQFILSALLFVAAVSCHEGICPLYYSPVCGSDGHTYSNKCFFEYAQKKNPSLTLSNLGECKVKTKREVNEDDCPEHSKNGICTLEYAPVCASNGQTYGNKCGMCADMYRQRKEGKDVTFKVVHPGKCGSLDYCLPRDESGACTMEYMPICGSDGTTYGNRCTFCFEKHQLEQDGHVLTMEYVGECLNCPAMSKQGACPRNYRPVCGSDGKTYANLCTLCVEIYKNNDGTFPGLRKQHEGVCESEATLYEAEFCRPEWRSGACTREYNPICGTDGKTYGNPCTFCYAMYQKQDNGNDMGVKREGPCQDEDKLVCPEMYKNGICTLEYSPVCGTDGREYPNKCMFCIEQANKLKEGVEIYFDHYGKCSV